MRCLLGKWNVSVWEENDYNDPWDGKQHYSLRRKAALMGKVGACESWVMTLQSSCDTPSP